MMKRRDRVERAIEFRGPDRVPFVAYVPGVSDIFFMLFYPARDWQPGPEYYPNLHPGIYYLGNWRFKKPIPLDLTTSARERQDEFGCVWKSGNGISIGEVVGHPLGDWSMLEDFRFPDPYAPGRFDRFALYKKLAGGDSFVLGSLDNGLWERAHFLRGFSELLIDTVADPERVGRLLDRLLDEWFIPITEGFAAHGAHGVMMTDDWGTQERLMIRPDAWRAIIKPRYARLIGAAHDLGLKFFLHSCGYIRDIIPDLIDIGLDVLQKDDVCFMGLKEIAEEFGGRICFMGPLDLQRVMPGADRETLYRETRRLLRALAADHGGYIGMHYAMPEAAGLTWAQMLTMHAAFLRYGRYPIR